MSLVAYGSSGSSDESDSEETDTINDVSKVNSEPPINDDVIDDYVSPSSYSATLPSVSQDTGDKQSNGSELFSHLPSPKSTFSIPDNTLRLLSKKQPVKIVLPSLNDIQPDEEKVKKPKPSTKGSGLFALLPAPKHSAGFVPHVLTKMVIPPPKKVTPKKPLLPNSLKSKPSTNSKSNISDFDDDDELDKPESFFFDSVEVKPDEMEPVVIPDITPKSHIAEASSKNLEVQSAVEFSQNQLPGTYLQDDNNMDTNEINDEAIEKLCGVGAKKRKGVPDEIIEINVDSMVGDAYMWLSKDLSKEQEHSGFKKPKNLSSVERRKHQITYLASQAKEKEMELRNQWANSRMTRKQTQSKYGF